MDGLDARAGAGFRFYFAQIPDDWDQVQLVVSTFSNSTVGAERFDIDAVTIRGVLVPEPMSATLAGTGLLWVLIQARWRSVRKRK
jgi:hypothetical protein